MSNCDCDECRFRRERNVGDLEDKIESLNTALAVMNDARYSERERFAYLEIEIKRDRDQALTRLASAVECLQEIERIASRMDPENTSKTWQDICALAFRGQP